MAQGSFKSKSSKPNIKAKKSKPTQRQKNISKGWKSYSAKGRKVTLAKQEAQTSKAINRKNEIEVAARAVGAGNTFYLKDIKDAGKKELAKQKTKLTNKERNAMKMHDRLKVQLDKLK
mmetsp:Transcript_11926/g.29182  ORF Transcript_11926/g.29182 Transcript_11926/m.29182 type:complete len:118 (-) Transcript_11926:311-664(-)|eukprot:CAMPEP_0181128178 /NCGR_PEP_ID=MMETSP1071-20121207/28608_1 /TAXON_ID=35127 /ORGANISM="Thalassiosira sp., Strain NH16" /LENGTH=117 /DNA_ID=CAMNT_0023213997 /DNA_START=261 /DNA_END=614 /DNA_ORIENTATION=-